MIAEKENLELTMMHHDSFQLFCNFILHMAHAIIIKDREVKDEDGYDPLLVTHATEQHCKSC